MSFSYAYNPKVAIPDLRNDIPQMQSGELQKPFFFGASQVPYNIPALSSSSSSFGGEPQAPSSFGGKGIMRYGTIKSGAGGMGQVFYAK